MAAEPTLEPTIAREEEQEESDEGEESDVYEIEVLCYSLPNQARNELFLLTSGTVGRGRT